MSLRREPSSPSLRRIPAVSALLTLVLAAALFAATPATPAAADDVGDWLTTINSFRSSKGLPLMQYDAELSGLAAQQAAVNAGTGGLAHTPNLANGVGANWTKLGENVGKGPSTASIWDAFLGSAPHLANLSDPAFTHVGIGVVWSGGMQFVTHRFMAVGADAPPPQPEPVYVPPPVTQPPVTAPRVTAPPVTAPPTTAAPTTTVPPPPPPVVVPAASAVDRSAAVLDALHGIEP